MPTHIPVLVNEIMTFFAPNSDSVLLDATLGLGGHSEAFLHASDPGGKIVGLEADSKALEEAKARLAKYTDRCTFIHTNFFRIKDSVAGGGILNSESPFSHVLFDLGIGSHQLSDSERGFSFSSEGPLRMKFGTEVALPPSEKESLNMLERRLGTPPDALEIIHQLSSEELADIIFTYGEERYARRIAKALQGSSGVTAHEVAQVIARATPHNPGKSHLNPATRTFQALRIAVNRELEALKVALPQALEVLKPEGKLAVISFHSLEDRIVKNFFREESRQCICPPEQPICTCEHKATLKVVTSRPIRPSEEEIEANPRARSSRLRLAVKLPP